MFGGMQHLYIKLFETNHFFLKSEKTILVCQFP